MSCSSVGAEGERTHCGEWLSRTQARTLDERQVQTEYVRMMADLAVNLLTFSSKNHGNNFGIVIKEASFSLWQDDIFLEILHM